MNINEVPKYIMHSDGVGDDEKILLIDSGTVSMSFEMVNDGIKINDTSSNIHDFSNIHYAHCFGDADETTLYHLTIDGLHTILGDRFHLR